MSRLVDAATVMLTCTRCGGRHVAQARHLDNLLAAGPWTCSACLRSPL